MPSLDPGLLFTAVAAVVGLVTPEPPPTLNTCEGLLTMCDEFGLTFVQASALDKSYSIFIFKAD